MATTSDEVQTFAALDSQGGWALVVWNSALPCLLMSMLSRAKQPEIGKDVDVAMDAIEKENQPLKDVLPKVYARQNLDPTSLGGLINLIGNIALGKAKSRSADVLGRVFEYFLGEFALAEGKKGGSSIDLLSPIRLFTSCATWLITARLSQVEWVKNCWRFLDVASGTTSAIRSMFLREPACIKPRAYWRAFQ